jgi:hypothetical protein
MLQLLELMPLVIFVLVFGLKDQTVSMCRTPAHIRRHLRCHRRPHDRHGTASTAGLVAETPRGKTPLVAAGSGTDIWQRHLILHNQLFIQWKPTIFNWALCLVLLGSHYFTKQNLVERILDKQIQLPTIMYKRITVYLGRLFFYCRRTESGGGIFVQ